MIESLPDNPPGVIGLRSTGKLTREDYVGVLRPALDDAIAAGSVRMVFVLDEFDGLEPAALLEDLKTGVDALFRNRSAWKRFALVTDIDWIAKATRAFTWMMPGEVAVYEGDDLDDALRWVEQG